MKVLLTGSSGFLGQWLKWAFLKKGWEVFTPEFDIRNFNEVESTISALPKPNVIIHLAGISSPDVAEKDPALAFAVNTMGTQILISVLEKLNIVAPLVFASTGQVYNIPIEIESSEVELEENSQIKPQNIYALSKWHGELIVSDSVKRGGLIQAINLRIFNHSHYTQSPQFFLPRIYKILMEESSSSVKIPVGNIDLYRDIGSIFDLCDAFVGLLESFDRLSSFEVFNLSSGTRRHLKTVAELLANRMNKKIEFIVDPKRVRLNEPSSICGKNDRIKNKINWSPQTQSNDELIASFFKDMI